MYLKSDVSRTRSKGMFNTLGTTRLRRYKRRKLLPVTNFIIDFLKYNYGMFRYIYGVYTHIYTHIYI